MLFHNEKKENLIKALGSSAASGLSDEALKENRRKYGVNVITKKKNKGLFSKIIEAVTEPMMIILLFSLAITLGTNIGKYIKSGEGDFVECIGIFLAIALSVAITLFMEGSSEKAFAALGKIYDNISVKVIRNGKTVLVPRQEVAVGDMVFLGGGDKIVADGRLIESAELSVDESALTGESVAVKKNAAAILPASAPLADRINMVYSGTFVTAGEGKMLVTAVGNATEIGQIAGELSEKKEGVSPLNRKLNKLTKIITIIGGIAAAVVLILSVVRLILTGAVTFETVTDAFIGSIVLVVAAVPEGLPAIVAVSLALNMTKLAKDNALIKKLIATETAGAVSVICSDKTGTLTENRMTVAKICTSEFCFLPEKFTKEVIFQNFCANSTADIIRGKTPRFQGSSTEGALLAAYEKATGRNYSVYRDSFEVVRRVPFSSETKLMTTVIRTDSGVRTLVKGAIERLIPLTDLTYAQKQKALAGTRSYETQGKRVIAFAHKDADDDSPFKFDGYAVISDPVRKEVYDAVKQCKKAGIRIKMLTGDNINTATAIARELKILEGSSGAAEADVLMKLSDEELGKALERVCVVARSTPAAKLRIVRVLKERGEVVAVTGDGINDAPAIRHADVGIAMGVTGSEITKEAADVILLDDSFSTIVKAISFGRNVYRNLQRFILFQLTVNLSAVAFIILSLLTGHGAPFNTLQLLWINIIMDGPPALTLGLEGADAKLMECKPVGRDNSIVSAKMLARIILNGLFMAVVLMLQTAFNFLGCKEHEKGAAVFTLFILFQLFNAFNSRRLGKESALSGLSRNKLMPFTFGLAFLIHILIVQVGYKLFAVSPLPLVMWLKIIGTASTVFVMSEAYKLVYRVSKSKKPAKRGRISNLRINKSQIKGIK